MIDFNLKPCPLCGGEARVECLSQGRALLEATIICDVCGLTLNWSTDFYVGESIGGKTVVVQHGLDPFQAWNRRTTEQEEKHDQQRHHETD